MFIVIKYFRNFVSYFTYLSIPKTVLVFSGILILVINNPVYSLENFKVLQTNTITDQSGFIHLFGEIRNISNEPQDGVAIYAIFYDKNGQNIGNASGIVAVRSLNIGQVSPFEIIVLDKDKCKQVSYYPLN